MIVWFGGNPPKDEIMDAISSMKHFYLDGTVNPSSPLASKSFFGVSADMDYQLEISIIVYLREIKKIISEYGTVEGASVRYLKEMEEAYNLDNLFETITKKGRLLTNTQFDFWLDIYITIVAPNHERSVATDGQSEANS